MSIYLDNHTCNCCHHHHFYKAQSNKKHQDYSFNLNAFSNNSFPSSWSSSLTKTRSDNKISPEEISKDVAYFFQKYSFSDFNDLIKRSYPDPVSGYATHISTPTEPVTAKSIANKFWDKEDLLRDKQFSLQNKIKDLRFDARKAHNKTLDFEDDLRKAQKNAEAAAKQKENEALDQARKEAGLNISKQLATERSYSRLTYNYLSDNLEDLNSTLNSIKVYKENSKLKTPMELVNLSLNVNVCLDDQGFKRDEYFRPCTSLIETSRQSSRFHNQIEFLTKKLDNMQASHLK